MRLVCCLGLGLVAGRLAASALRRRGLRWTWALAALPLPLVALPLSPSVVTTLAAAAALCAAVNGRRRHRQDLAAGGDLAELANSRRGPLAWVRAAMVVLLERHGASPAAAALGRERLLVGRDERSRVVSIPFGADGGRHTLVVGATGSGKTVTETWIACRAVEAGWGVVVVDPKGDRRLRERLARSAREAGRSFLQWTPEGPGVYNPFGSGSPGEIADKALACERFTEPHYQRQAQRYLAHAVRALSVSGGEVSLRALVQALDPERLLELVERLPEQQARAGCDYLDSLSPRQRGELGGVRDRLAILAESDVAGWLDPDTPGAVAFDLLEAVRARTVVYFALEADSRPLLAQMLGAAIVGDLRGAISRLQRSPLPTLVVIDEFAALAAEQVAHLFGRARSAGVSLVLGTQELADLRVEGRPQLREQVLGNLSALIAHRQVVADSAELVSRLSGRGGGWRLSHSSNGGWTRSRAPIAVLDAERVRTLPVGHAAVLDLTGVEPVRLARMFSTVA